MPQTKPSPPLGRRAAFGLLAAAGCGVPAARAAATILVGSGHGLEFGPTRLLDSFLPELQQALGNAGMDVEFDVAWGGSVARVPELYTALRDGLLQLAPVLSLFEPVKLAPLNVTYACPFATADVHQLARAAPVFEAPDSPFVAAWRAAGIEPLGSIWVDSYQLWSKAPVRRWEDLAGLTIGAPGDAGRWFTGAGAKVLSGSLMFFQHDLERGLLDAVTSFSTGAIGAKLHRWAPILTIVDFGAQYMGTMGANLDWFRGLTPTAQDALRRVGRRYGEASAAQVAVEAEVALRRSVAEGATIERMAPKQRRAWIERLPDVSQLWAGELNSPGDATRLTHAFLDGLEAAGVQPERRWG